MGVLLVQLLRARGARVIAAVRGKAKVDAVGEAGADVVIDYGQPGWTSSVLDATGGVRPGRRARRRRRPARPRRLRDHRRRRPLLRPRGAQRLVLGDRPRRRSPTERKGHRSRGPSDPAGRTRRPRPSAPPRGRRGENPPAHRPDLPARRGRPRARADGSQRGHRQDPADLGLIAASCGSLPGSAVTPRSRAAAEICRASSTSRELSPPTSCVTSRTTTLGYRRSTSGW